MKRYQFKRGFRLKGGRAFREVLAQGKVARGDFLTVHVLLSPSPSSAGQVGEGKVGKIGITIGRRVAPAVERNRLKRVLREIYRLNKESLVEGAKVVLRVNKAAAGRSYKELEEELLGLLSVVEK